MATSRASTQSERDKGMFDPPNEEIEKPPSGGFFRDGPDTSLSCGEDMIPQFGLLQPSKRRGSAPISPQNATTNASPSACDKVMRVSNMVRHDHQSMPVDELLQEAESAIERATREDRLREQMQISERLNEYYVQVVAEIRATLERVEAEG
jgi:hypothetical protein